MCRDRPHLVGAAFSWPLVGAAICDSRVLAGLFGYRGHLAGPVGESGGRNEKGPGWSPWRCGGGVWLMNCGGFFQHHGLLNFIQRRGILMEKTNEFQ